VISAAYREIQPSARLANYVECYWSNIDEGLAERAVLPDGCADILFTRKNNESPHLTIVGLMTKPLPVAPERGQSYFGIRFQPGMAAAFIPETPTLNDRTEPLESVWGNVARQLSDRLAEASDVVGMISIAEQSLRPLEPPDPAVRILWQMPQAAAPLEELVSAAGLSERHFRRQCSARAGVSPKYLERILRFRRALERIRAMASHPAQPSWAQLAVACNYYDQAHLIHDFQNFAGCAPGRFLQSLRNANGLQSNHDERSQT
jgi:AraC-like DNA-binding protein